MMRVSEAPDHGAFGLTMMSETVALVMGRTRTL
jgi:hypothetical protein